MNIPEEIYQELEAIISSEKSVVGIDAKKTHILILYQLKMMEERIGKMESLLEEFLKK